MNKGITTILYPVRDIGKAKQLYSRLLGVDPIMDQPYYVGYQIGNQDIGLVPEGSNPGMTGATAFYEVSDIKQSLEVLRQEGAQILQEPRDVGGGKLVANARDADGNMVGFIQMP
jgi:predicted enzyme related to lactoylglutathione lyase